MWPGNKAIIGGLMPCLMFVSVDVYTHKVKELMKK